MCGLCWPALKHPPQVSRHAGKLLASVGVQETGRLMSSTAVKQAAELAAAAACYGRLAKESRPPQTSRTQNFKEQPGRKRAGTVGGLQVFIGGREAPLMDTGRLSS